MGFINCQDKIQEVIYVESAQYVSTQLINYIVYGIATMISCVNPSSHLIHSDWEAPTHTKHHWSISSQKNIERFPLGPM